MNRFDFQPVLIIGAARSGTNMLRDLLSALPGVATWPCDEINYVWRYGNARYPTDELTPEHARADTIAYIRRQFTRLAKRTGARWIIEKTCANSLRVDYVRAIVPEAKFIFLVRDGRDAALSAERRWGAPLDVRYVLKKAAYVPLRDLPHYAARYLGHRFYKLFNGTDRLPTWGPMCEQIAQWSERLSIGEICIRQWERCVNQASQALSRHPDAHVHYLRYERFVDQPVRELSRICGFLGIPHERETLSDLCKAVSRSRVGKAANEEPTGELVEVAKLVETTLANVALTWKDHHESSHSAA